MLPPRFQVFWRQFSASNNKPNMNNYLSFNDKVALVTGASSGMGLATAQAFAEAGASVVLADFKEEAVRKAAEKLVNEDHRALAIHCDVSNDAQVEAMVERTVAEFRPAGAPAARTDTPVGKNPFSVRAWGAGSATSPLGAMEIERRAVGPNDVLLDILYCGICHSDIHRVRDEWNEWGPTVYPCVPGHEIIGRVVAVGDKVTKFKVGDIGGVGRM